MNGPLLGFAALLVAGGAAVLWFRALQNVSLPENRSGYVAAWLAGGVLGAAALVQGAGWLGGVPAGLAILLAVFFCFTMSISRQTVGDGAIAVGATLPAFTALDEDGKTFDSASLAGHPVLIKFFRGHW